MSANPNNLNLGLSVSDVVNISVSLTPNAAGLRNFGAFIVLGDSDVIDTQSRIRSYSTLPSVGLDFPTTAPEYQAAKIFFGQKRQPSQLYIGAWARTATSGALIGGVLGATQQQITNFTAVTNGGLNITVNGTVIPVTGINLSAVTNLNGVASALQTALGGVAIVIFNPTSGFFEVESATTGPASTVSFASAPSSGTDLSALMGLTSTSGGFVVTGIAAESALAAATIVTAMTNNWYGLVFAASVMPSDADYTAVAGFIQGASPSRIFGVTTQEAAALNAQSSTDIASQLQALGYSRVFTQYSSSSPHAVMAIPGIVSTVDFLGDNTLYTLMFQQEVGVVAETLTEPQARALAAKNCNVSVNYNISTTSGAQIGILQQGTMANGTYFDVIHGTDWLQNFIQTNLFNLYIQAAPGKIPGTDAGVTQNVTNITQSLEQSVTNGLVAPGVWTGPDIGAIKNGQMLSQGYYVFAPPASSRSAAQAAARQTPVMQVAIKLAEAFHGANVLLNVNQ
jgi:hypothetical protein